MTLPPTDSGDSILYPPSNLNSLNVNQMAKDLKLGEVSSDPKKQLEFLKESGYEEQNPSKFALRKAELEAKIKNSK